MNEALATQTPESSMSSRWVVLVHLTALPAWLAMSRAERETQRATHLVPVLADHPAISMRWIDVEAFSAESSDVMIAELDDPAEWNLLFERLRDTPMFTTPWFRLDRILLGLEDGYRSVSDSAT